MQLASLPTRLGALIIDNVILWAVGGIVGSIIGESILGIGIGFILGISYNWYFWTKNNGQTPGKALLGIRVVKANGGKIDTITAVVRYVGYYINTFLLFIGWAWSIWDPKKQGFHDKLAGTLVVRA